MSVDRSREIEIIVNTLLQVGERVMEISRDHTITRIWDHKDATFRVPVSDYLGRKIGDITNDEAVAECDRYVESSFLTGENGYVEYTTVVEGRIRNFGLRIINAHPDKDFLFIVVECVVKGEQDAIVENKWKLALDASGDGAFDTNIEEGTIRFSDKWHEMFGYRTDEVVSVEQWSAKIHPDDLAPSLERFRKYVSGELPGYASEMRYRCSDGSYKWILSRGVVISKTGDGKPLRFIGTHTDITERKIAEERYASTAQLLAKLINNIQTSILVIDENWKVIFANEVYQDLYKERGDLKDLIGMDMKKNLEVRKHFYVDPEGFYNRTIQIFDKKEIVIGDELETVDGKIISRDYIPLALGENNKGGIWKFKDITEQKSADKRLQEQRLFYERILNNIPADIAVFDAQHRYLFVNKNAFKNDVLREYMIGRTDEDYARYSNRPASFVEKRFDLYDGAMSSGKQVEFIEKLTSKEGKIGHHLRLIRPVYFDDGSFEFLMAYGVEITDLIVAQEELKTSIDTFLSAFNHSGIGMALIATDGKWLDVNNVMCALTGYTKDELLEKTYHDITYPPDDELDRPLINKLLTREISTYTIEKRYLTKENKILLVSLTVSLVWNEDAPKFFIAQVVDITEKKALENEIMRKNMVLEATRISLVNKIAQLEELNHIIAHNLRGPAGNVKMFSEVLLAKQNGSLAEAENPLVEAFTQEEAVQFIYDSSMSMMSSLNTLMEITQIKLNKEVPYNDCDITATVNGIISQLQSTIYEKKAVIKLDLEVEQVSYPKPYLENVLYNLISNSLKYSSTKAIPEILITTKVLKNKRTQIIVKDNGLGIDMEQFGDKVFKLNQTFHVGYDSKGVGLYITKTQVESLGGSIVLKSKPDEGCEFIVTL